ncbi:MAG TPA: universal stress protein [Patescibacteria group bacterium]|nr:universal stress protein [Patescibacteria group bacterium]
MAKRILVSIGTNERAEVIVPVVAALARDGGGTVRLLSVQPLQRTRFDDTLPLYGYDAGVTLEVQQRVLSYAHTHEERLESETLERLRQLEPLLDGVAVERAVRFGDLVEEIVREAAAFDADLIAVTDRRRPWWRPALSRLVDRVRSRARVPVLMLSGAAR